MDLRHCDGPGCDTFSELDHPRLDYWVTLQRRAIALSDNPRELHFHNEKCLLAWAKENTRNV